MSIPNFTMTGKVALVTGGRQGMGKAFAVAFAEAGADVAICDYIYDGELEAVADGVKGFGRHALAIRADVSRKADVENMVNKTVTELGGIDILINNAGVFVPYPSLEIEEEDWDRAIDVNLKGPFLCSQAVSRVMVERKRGSIINIASWIGLRSLPQGTGVGYGVAKAGLIMLTRVLARELGSHNIRVNAIAPGVVKTALAVEALLSNPESAKARLANYPLGRFGETDDVIGAVLFLASDAASWITGHTISVDGGFLA